MATEKRLFYADEALRMLKNCRSDNPYFNGKTAPIWETALDCAISCVEACSTVDAVEVKHGRWLIDEYEYYDCSVCGESYFNGCDSRKEAEERLRERPYDVYAYCPYCGAKMDGDGNV